MSETPALRANGLYRFQDRLWSVVPLSSEGRAWGSTALCSYPFEGHHQNIVYLRHADGALLSCFDFRQIGTVADLEDTGEDTDP